MLIGGGHHFPIHDFVAVAVVMVVLELKEAAMSMVHCVWGGMMVMSTTSEGNHRRIFDSAGLLHSQVRVVDVGHVLIP